MDLEAVDAVGLELAKRARKGESNKSGTTYLNAYAFLNSKDHVQDREFRPATVCFGGVSGYASASRDVMVSRVHPMALDGYNENKLKANFGSYSQHRFTRAQLIRYYSWLTNHSPWRSVFITKSGSAMLDKQFVACHTKRPSNLLIGALIALRQAWEYTQIVDTWTVLREHAPDLDPAFAYWLGHILTCHRTPTGIAISQGHHSSSHTALDAAYGKTQVHNFVKGDLQQANRPLPANYMGVQNAWGSGYGRYNPSGEPVFSSLIFRRLKKGAKADAAPLLFGWNDNFIGDANYEMYPLEDNIPVLQDIFNELIGGN